ncbi:26.5 kDa heat shock protein, mitochondrial [Macadamia integrifolia]|uniref:26.5 kDa heat shock protein, mitochondrial n=1 Tax=Macadamia integrifolia TaxID=60698 RepID=UPI001C4F6AD0|nr:26.5 kDa heat shock protein, mitochondrial [Macadamia integrifolia]
MVMAGLTLKNLQQRVSYSYLLNPQIGNRGVAALQQQRWASGLLRSLSTATSEMVSNEKSSQGQEVPVTEGSSKKFKLFPSRPRRPLWRNDNHDLTPFSRHELFPSRLGNALVQAKERLNRLIEKLSPSRLIGRLKKDDEAYKLRYEVPGLAKEDLKITIVDGFLTIVGERKEEEDEEDWSPTSYGFYNAILLLPDDAKVDEIVAEMKDGVLIIIIPRAEKPRKEVKEVKIQ